MSPQLASLATTGRIAGLGLILAGRAGDMPVSAVAARREQRRARQSRRPECRFGASRGHYDLGRISTCPKDGYFGESSRVLRDWRPPLRGSQYIRRLRDLDRSRPLTVL